MSFIDTEEREIKASSAIQKLTSCVALTVVVYCCVPRNCIEFTTLCVQTNLFNTKFVRVKCNKVMFML